MNTYKRIIFIFLTILILSVSPVFADSYDTDFFKTTVNVSENNSYDIQETIRVNFAEPHHGIFRYIPEKGVQISNISVPNEVYSVYDERNNKVIKIGSADRVVSGKNTYVINYKISMWADKNDKKDKLLINVMPTDWESPVSEFECIVKMPKKADMSSLRVYSGPYGTVSNACNVKAEATEKEIILSATNIPANNGITLSLDLPDGYWNAPAYGAIKDTLYFSIIAPLLALLVWARRNKHVVITPEFYPPKKMTPGEIGYYCDEEANDKDLFASIVYLASKNYLNIKDGENGIEFEEIQKPDSDEPEYVKMLYSGIFNKARPLKANKTRVVKSRNLGANFSRKFEEARRELASMFYGENTIYDNSLRFTKTVIYCISVIPSFVIASWLSSYDASYALILVPALAGAFAALFLFNKAQNINASFVYRILGCIVVIVAAFLMAATEIINGENWYSLLIWAITTLIPMYLFSKINTRKDTRLYGQILGFKEFIETAELDKLNALIEEDPKYFFNIIPYAYVFGLTDAWINKFEDIEIKIPEIKTTKKVFETYGYDMDRGLSNARIQERQEMEKRQQIFDSSSRDIESYISTHEHDSSDHDSWSSGGGFSGGGFSGGGSGGGGGGAW